MRAQNSLTRHQREQLTQLYEQDTGSIAAAKELKISHSTAQALEQRYISD